MAVRLSGQEPATAPVASRICSEPCVIAGAPDCAKSGSAKNKHTKRAEGLSINPSVTTQCVEAIGWPKRDSVRFQQIASCAIWNGLGKSIENARRAYGKREEPSRRQTSSRGDRGWFDRSEPFPDAAPDPPPKR